MCTTNISNHAFLRVQSRLSLAVRELKTLLEENLCVNIGYETGTRRVHRLFYSKPDKQCFVAVQDERDGLVVTVLSLDYHNAWRIPVSAQEMARDLVQPRPATPVPIPEPKTPEPEPQPVPEQVPKPLPYNPPTTFQVIVHLEKQGKVFPVNVGNWSATRYHNDIEKLLADEKVAEKARRIVALRIQDMDVIGYPTQVKNVGIRLGRKGPVTLLEKNQWLKFGFQQHALSLCAWTPSIFSDSTSPKTCGPSC